MSDKNVLASGLNPLKYDSIIDWEIMENEKDIVEKAKTDPHYFGLLFDKYHDKIYKYILHRTANIELSRDLTSDTFFKALKNINSFTWKSVSISSWLYRIATNEVNMYFRKYGGFNKTSLEDIINIEDRSYPLIQIEIKDAHRQLEDQNMFLELQKSLEKLKAKYQEVIVLKFFDELKIKEISEILNKSEGTVKSLIHRGLNKLRTRLKHSILFKEGE